MRTFPQNLNASSINGRQSLHHRGLIQLILEDVDDQLRLGDVTGSVRGANPQVELVDLGVVLGGQRGGHKDLAAGRRQTEQGGSFAQQLQRNNI